MEYKYEITIPPQKLIQILVAEAAGELYEEASKTEVDGAEVVDSDSSSPTGDAVGAVIRNRISLINSNDDTSLFMADANLYDSEPNSSYYDAVIEASGQFAPVDPTDPSHRLYANASERVLLDDIDKLAYDQAVITAAGIFNGDTWDPTVGAFAFRSPNSDEWALASLTMAALTTELPDGIGFSDASFPSLAPIQILVHPEVSRDEAGKPSFIFARRRMATDFAATNIP